MTPIKTDYMGVSFRSRLEAKWAAFFDLCDWPWEYEPLDLDGYIPDFVLRFYKPMLVEVKPELYLKDLGRHIEKIAKSGWNNEALIVGACIFDDGNGWASLGIHGQKPEAESPVRSLNWETAIFHKCTACNKYSFHNSVYVFECVVNGCYDGDHFLDMVDYQTGRKLFGAASSTVQYNQ